MIQKPLKRNKKEQESRSQVQSQPQSRFQTQKRAQHILLIGVDQMRWDTPGFMKTSPCRTPHIDSLAAGGVVFTEARTPCSLCSPARASLFTGDYAFQHGMGTNCDMYHPLSEELKYPDRLLHKKLQDKGFRCAYIGKWHVGKDRGPGYYGFEGMDIPGYGDIRNDKAFKEYLQQHGYSYDIRKRIYGNDEEQTLLAGLWDGPTASSPAHYLADRTIALLKDLSTKAAEKKNDQTVTSVDGDRMDWDASDRPFFLTCQFWGPHMPHLPSREFYGMHDRSKIAKWINSDDDWNGKPGMVKRMGEDFYQKPPQNWSEWAEIIGLYYDFTAMIDYEIGRILKSLKELGLEDDTLVIFTSDHGDMTGSHGGLLDKGFLYEEAHRIPLIVSGPGVEKGIENDDLVMNMDIFPTILDYLGLSREERSGQSFLGALGGLTGHPHASLMKDNSVSELQDCTYTPRDALYMEFHGLRFLYSQRALLTAEGLKYIFTPGDQDELYDLNDDPGELKNRIHDDAYATEKRKLQERMILEARHNKDPLASCLAKLFGHWKDVESQPNPTRV